MSIEQSFRRRITGESTDVVAAEHALADHLNEAEMPSMVVSRAMLVLEEHVLNATRHGGAPEVTLDVVLMERGCLLRFEDEGMPFDPLSGQFAEPDPAMLGGRGLLLIRRSASDARYMRVGNKNCLEIKLDG